MFAASSPASKQASLAAFQPRQAPLFTCFTAPSSTTKKGEKNAHFLRMGPTTACSSDTPYRSFKALIEHPWCADRLLQYCLALVSSSFHFLLIRSSLLHLKNALVRYLSTFLSAFVAFLDHFCTTTVTSPFLNLFTTNQNPIMPQAKKQSAQSNGFTNEKTMGSTAVTNGDGPHSQFLSVSFE
jgi:hypothetical protein